MWEDAQRCEKMKKIDKVSLVIIVLNIISSLCFFAPAGTLWSSLFLGFIFYSIFIMWLSIPIGIVLNIISVVKIKKL